VQTTGEAGGAFRLFVDDKLVFDNWTTSKGLLNSTIQNLSAQPHKIVFERKGRPGFLGSRLRFGILRSGTLVEEDALKIAAQADVIVLTPGFYPESESEGADRTFRLPPGQDELIARISAANKRTIVVMTSGGNVDMNSWVDHVPALIEAWYPGEQGGNALAEILFGDVNPSGKLPVTFERYAKDNPTFDNYYPVKGTNKVVYNEGVFVGYRGYEHNNITPRFPFGYGLSYTSFSYSGLNIQPVNSSEKKGLYEVTFTVKNTGKVQGAEVSVSIYAGVGTEKLVDAGWYVFCNGRQIEQAEKTKRTGWDSALDSGNQTPRPHWQFRRFRGYIFFESANSQILPWNTMKTGLNVESPVYRKVWQQMAMALRDVITFLNAVDAEEDDEGPLHSCIDTAKWVQLKKLPENASFRYPSGVGNSASMTTISFRRDAELVARVKDQLGVTKNYEVGEEIFDFYVKAKRL